jgi:hypothetical protein
MRVLLHIHHFHIYRGSHKYLEYLLRIEKPKDFDFLPMSLNSLNILVYIVHSHKENIRAHMTYLLSIQVNS